MIIRDIMPGIKRKLGNRADADDTSPLWIKDALLEITESYPFEELKVDGPVVNLEIGKFSYPITFFTNNNEMYSQLNSWFVSSLTSFDPNITANNNNNTGRYLKYRTIPVLDIMTKTPGQPSKWTRNGMNVWTGPTPDQNYASQWRYQRVHPLPTNKFDPIALQSQTIFIPDSWSIVLEYWAAMVGASENRMLDYKTDYHNTLFGDPDFRKTGRGNPGLIFSRTSNYDRDSSSNERQLQMVQMTTCAR